MNKKITLMALALLGFSTACSGVKNGPKDGVKSDTTHIERTPVVMYGVRIPEEATQEIGDMKKFAPSPEKPIEIVTKVLQEKKQEIDNMQKSAPTPEEQIEIVTKVLQEKK